MAVSGVVPLQQRIVGVFERAESLSWTQIAERLGGSDHIGIDTALSAMVRAGKLECLNSKYSLSTDGRKLQGLAAVATDVPAEAQPAPTAEQEAAASLQPKTLVCEECKAPKPEAEFRLLVNDVRAKKCNACHGKKTGAGQKRANERRATRVAAAELKFHSAQKSDNGTEALKVGHQTVNLAGTPPIAGSSPAGSTIHGSGDAEQGDGAEAPIGSPCSADASSAASTQPVLADSVLERARAKRQEALNRITLLEVELANERAKITRCEQFIELYSEFSHSSPGNL